MDRDIVLCPVFVFAGIIYLTVKLNMFFSFVSSFKTLNIHVDDAYICRLPNISFLFLVLSIKNLILYIIIIVTTEDLYILLLFFCLIG